MRIFHIDASKDKIDDNIKRFVKDENDKIEKKLQYK
jgi:hypothetical protein